MSSSTNSIPSPLSIRMNTPDPLMDPELATLLCTTLALCPGHMRGYTSQGFRSLEDIANTTMNTLHHLSQQHDHIDPYFPHHPQFSTADFFSELLLLLQWATYHNRPLSDFNIDILTDLEENGTDSELCLHFEQLLHYSSGPPTASTPTIRDLNPNLFFKSTPSSQLNSTTSTKLAHTKSSYEYSSDDDSIQPHPSITQPSPSSLPTSSHGSTPITSTINKIAASPSDDESINHSSPTATAFNDGFDAGVEAASADLDYCAIHDNDHDAYCDNRNNDNYEYDDGGYNDDGYDDGGYNDAGYDDYEPDIDPEPPPSW